MLGVFLSGNQDSVIIQIYFWSLVFAFFIITLILLFVYNKINININWLEAIIIAVQEAKFATQESLDSTVLYKLNEIIGGVDAINQKTDHLEKN